MLVALQPFDPHTWRAAHLARRRRLYPPPRPPEQPPLPPPPPPPPRLAPRPGETNFIGPPRRPRTAALRIITAVACHYRVSVKDILGGDKHHPIVIARQVACYLIHRHGGKSYPHIARIIGGRDHTTIMHAVNKIRRLVMSGDPAIGGAVRELNLILGEDNDNRDI